MRALFKPSEKILDDFAMMIRGETYMVDGFILTCSYKNLSVFEFKAVTHAKEIRNCDVEARRKDLRAEPARDRQIVMLRSPGAKIPTAMEAAMDRALKT